MRRVVIGLGFSLASCNAYNPFILAPENSASTWMPMEGSTLISSQYCQTYLPPSFGDHELSLANLLDIGLKNNPTTKQTWAAARAAAASYGQALSDYYPDIEFNGTYTRERAAFSLGGVPINYYLTTAGPNIEVTYTVLDFGVRSATAEAAKEALYYADWTHNQQIQTVIQTVMDDYYTYLYQKEVLKGNEENLVNAQAALDAANQKFSLGLAALGDVAQARTQFLQNKINLTTQKQNVENAYAQLASDIGIPSTLRFKMQPIPDQLAIDPILEGVDALISEAKMRRPEIIASLANIRSKAALVKQAKSEIFPTLNGTFEYGRFYFNDNQKEPRNHFVAELALTFPIFDGFYYRNGIKNAQANYDQAVAELVETELSIIQEVTTGRSNVYTAAENLRDSYDYLASAKLEFDIALANYQAGTMTLLDVLNAQSSLADARTKKASAQDSWLTSLAAIAYATGALCSGPCKTGCKEGSLQ